MLYRVKLGEVTCREWDKEAGVAERVEDPVPKPGRTKPGLETEKENSRLGRRREAVAPVDRTARIDLAIVAAISAFVCARDKWKWRGFEW